MILGQRKLDTSGLDLAILSNASAARRPPILHEAEPAKPKQTVSPQPSISRRAQSTLSLSLRSDSRMPTQHDPSLPSSPTLPFSILLLYRERSQPIYKRIGCGSLRVGESMNRKTWRERGVFQRNEGWTRLDPERLALPPSSRSSKKERGKRGLTRSPLVCEEWNEKQ